MVNELDEIVGGIVIETPEFTPTQLTCNGAWYQATVIDGYECVKPQSTLTCSKDGTDAPEIAFSLDASCGDLTGDTTFTVDEEACNLLKEQHKDDENWPSDLEKASWGYVSVCGGATSVTVFGAAIVAAIAALAF